MHALNALLIATLELAGAILPLPCAVWAWLRWLRSQSQLMLPMWRAAFAFGGLLLISVALLTGLFVLFYFGPGNATEGQQFNILLKWNRINFWGCALAVCLSVVGGGRSRLPTALSALGLMTFWFMAVVMY